MRQNRNQFYGQPINRFYGLSIALSCANSESLELVIGVTNYCAGWNIEYQFILMVSTNFPQWKAESNVKVIKQVFIKSILDRGQNAAETFFFALKLE